ncbi:MAG: DUF3617 domain-containing protein [Candidatus Nitricoxidivorans perseverans]|uniref:DUF3617 domain-containing protein n=1 Tax=Candidatus Nitricoxidivorans perseverans TaxID=2975601 RepID=A0AA49FMX6_9PROT|nr:MAG: DUF3617 domain-containing protein [Candidatus Nitricoxidivorans perseverans]
MNALLSLSLALPLTLGLGSPAWAAGGPDELWEITSSMTDKVSGFAMPANTMRQCLKKGAGTKEVVPVEKDCRLMDIKTSGSKTSFRFECAGKNRISGSGEIDRPNTSSYGGHMRMKGATEAQKVDMTMNYSGKRVGGCTFGEPMAAMPGGLGGKGQMPAMQGMTPEQMKQLKQLGSNPEAMRKMFGGGQ